MLKNGTIELFALLLVIGVLSGCTSAVYLMPTPVFMRTGEHDPFQVNPTLSPDTRVPVLYATNRAPLGNIKGRTYTIFVDKSLRLGVADIRIGNDETTWETLYRISTSGEKDARPKLYLENLTEWASIAKKKSGSDISEPAKAFFKMINNALAESLDKDLMVYVHGANSSVYRASAQAAQYRHFTGRNSVVLAFLWPSAENILKYGTDVAHAAKTAPFFARLIDLLSRHTDARNINILAYSAGGQIVSPGLSSLGNTVSEDGKAALKKRLRLGEIYYAAPDVDFKVFVEQLPHYMDLAHTVTVAANVEDSVLAFSERFHGVSRAGRGNPEDLSKEEFEWLLEVSRQPFLDILIVDAANIPSMRPDAHDFWYENAWVSSDVLIQLVLHASPAERGLQENAGPRGGIYWTFPHDYPDRIVRLIHEAKAALPER